MPDSGCLLVEAQAFFFFNLNFSIPSPWLPGTWKPPGSCCPQTGMSLLSPGYGRSMLVWRNQGGRQAPRGQVSSLILLPVSKAKTNYPAWINPEAPMIFLPGSNEPAGSRRLEGFLWMVTPPLCPSPPPGDYSHVLMTSVHPASYGASPSEDCTKQLP